MAVGFSRDQWYNYIADKSHPPVASAVVEKPEYDSDRVYAWKPANNYKGWKLIDKGEAGVDDAKVIQSVFDQLQKTNDYIDTPQKIVLIGDFVINESIVLEKVTHHIIEYHCSLISNVKDKPVYIIKDCGSIEHYGDLRIDLKTNQCKYGLFLVGEVAGNLFACKVMILGDYDTTEWCLSLHTYDTDQALNNNTFLLLEMSTAKRGIKVGYPTSEYNTRPLSPIYNNVFLNIITYRVDKVIEQEGNFFHNQFFNIGAEVPNTVFHLSDLAENNYLRVEYVSSLQGDYIGYITGSAKYNVIDIASMYVDVPIYNTSSYINVIKRNHSNRGTAVFDGDGSTTDFLIGDHGLKITDPDRIVVKVTPISQDAINASPCIGYVDPDDNTKIRVKFASAPASGTDNVKIVWKAEVVS